MRDVERLAELRAAVALCERRVDDRVMRADFADRARAGIERHLMRRRVKHVSIAPENLLHAIAVMHVKIDDGDARGAMRRARMQGRDGGVVEKAKAHRRIARRMMARRPHGDESVLGVAAHHRIDGRESAARGAQRRFMRGAVHGDVRTDARISLCGRRFRETREVFKTMRAQQSFLRRQRRLGAHEAGEARVVKRAQNGAKTLRPLDMRRPHVMRQPRRVRDEQGRGRRGARAEGEACASAGDCLLGA